MYADPHTFPSAIWKYFKLRKLILLQLPPLWLKIPRIKIVVQAQLEVFHTLNTFGGKSTEITWSSPESDLDDWIDSSKNLSCDEVGNEGDYDWKIWSRIYHMLLGSPASWITQTDARTIPATTKHPLRISPTCYIFISCWYLDEATVSISVQKTLRPSVKPLESTDLMTCKRTVKKTWRVTRIPSM